MVAFFYAEGVCACGNILKSIGGLSGDTAVRSGHGNGIGIVIIGAGQLQCNVVNAVIGLVAGSSTAQGISGRDRNGRLGESNRAGKVIIEDLALADDPGQIIVGDRESDKLILDGSGTGCLDRITTDDQRRVVSVELKTCLTGNSSVIIYSAHTGIIFGFGPVTAGDSSAFGYGKNSFDVVDVALGFVIRFRQLQHGVGIILSSVEATDLTFIDLTCVQIGVGGKGLTYGISLCNGVTFDTL